MIAALLNFLGLRCTHQHTYRERRELHKVMVLHWVCDDCGHAVPAVARTAKEHERIVKQGAVVSGHATVSRKAAAKRALPRASKRPEKVTDFRRAIKGRR